MTILKVTIPGQPVGKGRPRLTTRGGFARAFTPKKTRDWETEAAAVMRAAWGGVDTLTTPVTVTVLAVASRPKDLQGTKHPAARMWRPKRVDLDNVIKAVLDALMLAGVLADDALVVDLHGQSLYTAKGEDPCVELTIGGIDERQP